MRTVRSADLLTVSLLALLTCSGGGAASVEPKNGRIVIAAEAYDEPSLVALDLRSVRSRVVRGAQGVEWPTLSPDGRRLAFVQREPEGTPHLRVSRADGSGRRTLSRDGYSPAWSPDGQRIAYLHQGQGNVTSHDSCPAEELNIVGRDGRGRRRVYSGPVCEPRWSSDGAWIAFRLNNDSEGTFDLYVVHPNGRDARVIAEGVEPNGYSWSPDGQHLVFVANSKPDSFEPDLYTVPLAGGVVTQLTHDSRLKHDPEWSPDGSLIAFWSPDANGPGAHVVIVDPVSKGERQVADGWEPAWSPTGARLAFLGPDGIRSARPDGSDGRLVLHGTVATYYEDLRWAPRGRLFFTRTVYEGRSRLLSLGPDGSVKRLGSKGVAGLDPASSPGGRLIAFSRVRPAGNRELAIVRRDGSGLRMLTRNRFGWDYQPTWSPDGKRIAFVRSSAFRTGKLYAVSLRDSKVRLLAPDPQPFHPAWSPDGSSIAVDGMRSTDVTGIRVIDLGGRGVEQVTRPPQNAFDLAPSWSPDGTRLAFVRKTWRVHGYSEQDWIVTLSTGEEHPITQATGSGPPLAARWSPDGTRLAALSCVTDASFFCLDAGVATMRPDGSEPDVIWNGALSPTGLSWARR